MSDVNVYDMVTDKVLAELEQGNVPWRKPWTATNIPRSLATGKPYSGLNVFLLVGENRTSPWWMTYKQATERGGHIRKGEKSTLIVFWNMRKVHDVDPATGQKVAKVIPLLRYYRVFNLDQTEDVKLTAKEEKLTATRVLSQQEQNDIAEKIIVNYNDGPRTRHDGGDKAYYHPIKDMIHLPKRESFKGDDEYYATRFHEMVHSTGHGNRLGRHSGNEFFGNHPYGREELVAEMGSTFLAAEAGFLSETITNSAAYLKSWMNVLKEDNRAVVVAAGKAQKAVDYILGREGERNGS